MNLLWPYLAGALAVGVAYLLAAGFTGQWWPLRLAEGKDGRLSVSLLQFGAFTGAVVFGYVATVVARSLNGGDITTGVNIPSNLLIAMGFSATTTVTAKGITTAFVASGRVVKPQVPPAAAPAAAAAAPASAAAVGPVAIPVPPAAAQPPPSPYLSDLVQDDNNQTDLVKVQMIIWTLIAIGIFLVNVILAINAIKASGTPGLTSLPDIDGALMVLMGLSQGTYLGKKLVTSNALRITSVSPPNVSLAGNHQITVVGSGFGPAAPGKPGTPEDPSSMLLIGDYQATPANITTWSDTQIVTTLDPVNDPAISAFVASHDPSRVITISVLVAGQVPRDPSGNPQNVTVTVTP